MTDETAPSNRAVIGLALPQRAAEPDAIAAPVHAGLRSAVAKARLEAPDEGPFLVCDWDELVAMHYEADPQRLQRATPFPLDLFGGRAYFSLVAFTMRHLRLHVGGRLLAWLAGPVACEPLLNLRTYVVEGGEPGICFLAEWLAGSLSRFLGPRTYGLPYRAGRLAYHHHDGGAMYAGRVEAATGGVFAYRGKPSPGDAGGPAVVGSLDEFLMERYTAYTRRGSVRRRFRVWHEPWTLSPAAVEVSDASLLTGCGEAFAEARLVAVHRSPGVRGVWMGRPRCINGEFCARTWGGRPVEGHREVPPCV